MTDYRFSNEEPFGLSPDPRFFFATRQHAEAAASLYYAMWKGRGFASLIGEPGLGKTSVITSLLQKLAGLGPVVFLVQPNLVRSRILETVLERLGIDPAGDGQARQAQLADFLRNLEKNNQSCVVIFDEAQHLGAEALEEVRLLSNFETPERKLIQFIFAGQPSLETLLKSPPCDQIRQRIGIVARLRPMSDEDTAAYIAHRLSVAGAPANSFSRAAVQIVAKRSGGIPRLINSICFNARSLALADEKTQVNAEAVLESCGDMMLNEQSQDPVISAATQDRSQDLNRYRKFFSFLFSGRTYAVAVILTVGAVALRHLAQAGDL